jgi:hypothetical protein
VKRGLVIVLTGLICLPLAAQFSGGIRDQAKQSQGKVDQLTKRIDALDADIEQGIQEVVALLSSVRDSAGTSRSGTSRGSPVRPMLVDAKQQAILGLLDQIESNQRQLLALEGQVGKVWGTIPVDALTEQINALEAKVESRIDQVVAIAASMTRHEDLEQTSMVKRPGSGSTRFRKRTTNPDYILNQRVTSVSEPIRRRVAEELAASGDRLQRHMLKLESNLQQIDDTDRRSEAEAQLADLKQRLAKREKQFDAVASDEQPDTKVASLAEAETIKRQAHDKVEVIRQQHDELTRLQSERDLELNRLRGLQTRLQFMGG